MDVMATIINFKAISVTRIRLSVLMCFMTLAWADICAWMLTYQAIEIIQLVDFKQYYLLSIVWFVSSVFINKQYSKRNSFWGEVGSIAYALSMILVLNLILEFSVFKDGYLFPYLYICLTLMIFIPVCRGISRYILLSVGLYELPTVVIGSGENACQAVRALRGEKNMGYVVKYRISTGINENDTVRHVGELSHIAWPISNINLNKLRNYHCVVALEAHEYKLRDEILRTFAANKVKYVHVIPAMRGVPLYGLESTTFFSNEILMIHVRSNIINPLYSKLKRFFDIFIAALLIVICAPLMLWVSYRIWRCDGGPVIYSQLRIGHKLDSFKFYKFRSMVNNADEILKVWEDQDSVEWREYVANNFKLKNDKRLIDIGSLIRSASIDELPQLFNVLAGNMSLVGPRPLLPREMSQYGEDLQLYALATPGMTGLWQISGRSNTTFSDRVSYDTWYIKNCSLWMDLTILFKTWAVVFRGKGAY